MFLVADGGSTKTDWRLIKGNSTLSLTTIGINPLFSEKDQIIRVLTESDINMYKNSIEKVFFYGAGLANDQIKEGLLKIFVQFFGENTQIFINDDMLAAARALLGTKPGIACILGTGSNSCMYDGIQLVDKIPALGYILGDEGSGAYMGKRFINALLKRDFSPELTQKLNKLGEFDLHTIIENVYKKPLPNRYLASLTRLIKAELHEPELHALVYNSLEDFVIKNILKLPHCKELPVVFAGSIAFHFNEILNQVMKANGFEIPRVVQSPIDDLVAYHKTIKS
jgi:N-acetylglucosamine kinase-like BadF-type ATPase